MKSNQIHFLDTQDDILTPQDTGELFSSLLREYGDKNESYFFKLLGFYYFNIHLKTNLTEFQAFDIEEVYHGMEIRKQDMICLIGNFLLGSAKKAGYTSPEALHGFVKSIVQNIMNIFPNEKELPKFCYNLATKIKNDRGKIHNTLMRKDELFHILPINGYNTIYSYIVSNKKFTQGSADITQIDPWAFSQAGILPNDTLSYFFSLDRYQHISEIIQHQDILKKLVTSSHKRNEVDFGEHTHKDVTVTNIQENQNMFNIRLEYKENAVESSELHTLLHQTFSYYKKYIFEEKDEDLKHTGVQGVIHNILNKTYFEDEMKYIYHAIHDLQDCIQPIMNIENSKIISTETFEQYIQTTYPINTDLHTTFSSLLGANKNCIISQIAPDKYTIKQKFRGVIVTCNEHKIDLEYFGDNRIIGEQTISIKQNAILISKYNIPEATKKLQQWCYKYYVADYVTNQTRVPLDEYMLQLQKFTNERGEIHPGLDKNNAYIKYLLEHCISSNIILSTQENNLVFEPDQVDTDTEKWIATGGFKQFIDQLYNTYERGIQGYKSKGYDYSNTEKQLVEQKKDMFHNALHELGITKLTKDALIDAVANKWPILKEKTIKAASFSIQEQRSAQSLNTYLAKQGMNLDELLNNTILSQIVPSSNDTEKVITLDKLYSLCKEYDIFSYIHSSLKDDDIYANHIKKVIYTYADQAMQKNTEKLQNLLPEGENQDNFFERAPKQIHSNLAKLLGGNLYAQYIYHAKILVIKAYKENLMGNKKGFEIYQKQYIELIKEYQTEAGKQFKIIFNNNSIGEEQITHVMNKAKELLMKQPLWKNILGGQEKAISIMKADMKILAHEGSIALSYNNIEMYEEKKHAYNTLLKKFSGILEVTTKKEIVKVYENNLIRLESKYKTLFTNAEKQQQRLEEITSQGGIDYELEEQKEKLKEKYAIDMKKLEERYNSLLAKVDKKNKEKKNTQEIVDIDVKNIKTTKGKSKVTGDITTLKKEFEKKKDRLERVFISKLEKLIKSEKILDVEVLKRELEENKKVLEVAYTNKINNPTITQQSLSTYKSLFPTDIKTLIIPNDILNKHLDALGSQCILALQLLQENKIAKYDEIEHNFLKSIDTLKEELFSIYKVQGEITDEKTIENINILLTRYEKIFPSGGVKKIILHSDSMRQKYILKIITYRALTALVDNKIDEFNILKKEHDDALAGLDKCLKDEAITSNIQKKLLPSVENSINSTINSFRYNFPSTKLLGISAARSYTNEEFKTHIMKCEFDRLSQGAKNVILQQESEVPLESREKSNIEAMNHLYETLKKLPYIDDIYATHCIGTVPFKRLPLEIHSERARKYIQDHYKNIIIKLIEDKMLEDYLEKYIMIEDETTKKLFIKKTYQYIKSYLIYNKKVEIYHVGTYEYHLWNNILDENDNNDGIITGSMQIKLPILPQITGNESSYIDFQDI